MKKLTLTLIAAAFALAGSANILHAQDQAPAAPSTSGTNGDMQCPAGGCHHDDGDQDEAKGEHKGGHKHHDNAQAPSGSQGQ
jgi:hypothetical protein